MVHVYETKLFVDLTVDQHTVHSPDNLKVTYEV